MGSKSVSLMQAAHTLGMTYRAALDLVLRHDLDGQQDHARRWTVTVDSLQKCVEARSNSDEPGR
jgi:hypothetical protein